jgi:hypothetical protein
MTCMEKGWLTPGQPFSMRNATDVWHVVHLSNLEIVNQSPGLLQLFSLRIVSEHVRLQKRLGSWIHAQKQDKPRFVTGQSERGQSTVRGMA